MVIFALGAVGCIALAKSNDSEEVKQGAASAFSAGLAKFSNAVAKGDSAVPQPGPSKSHVYSLYTKGLTALGGGMPHLVEQYRKHSYTGLETTRTPVDHHIISDNLTPQQTAELTRPRPVYQYVQDRTLIP